MALMFPQQIHLAHLRCTLRPAMSTVEALLSLATSISAVTTAGLTPIFAAAKNGSVSIVKLLVAAGADVTAMLPQNRTLLHVASSYDNIELSSYLIDSANATVLTLQNRSVLHMASSYGHVELMKYLINAGVDINCVSGAPERRFMLLLEVLMRQQLGY